VSFDFEKCGQRVGVSFRDGLLLKQAFIHRSYINENPGENLNHNERLEFLGDAVLELIITDYLYHRFPDKAEGELTGLRSALVNTNTISETAQKIGMNDFLLLSRGEAKDTGRARQYILANTFEAVVGAVYLDQGYDKAKEFVEKHIIPLTDEIISKNLWLDAKSYFQEKAQEASGLTPTYKVHSQIGPDHAKQFTVGLYIGNQLVIEGEGHSKQEAEQEAARKGLEKNGWNK